LPNLHKVGFVLLATSTAHAAERHVPSQYATIQEAVDAADAGDEIVLASGEYREDIRVEGKALRFRPADPYPPEPCYCLYPVIVRFDGYTSLTNSAPDDARALEIVDVTEGEVAFEGIHLDLPFDRNYDNDDVTYPEAYSSIILTNSNVAFESTWFSGGGGNYLPEIIFEDSQVRLHRCFSSAQRTSGPFYFQLLDTNLTITESIFADEWFFLNPPASQSTVTINNTMFGEDGSGTEARILLREEGSLGKPRDLPDGYTLPEILIQDCLISDGANDVMFRGEIRAGGSFTIDGLTRFPDDLARVTLQLIADSGTIEIREFDALIDRDQFRDESPRIELLNGASLIIADSMFRGMESDRSVRPFIRATGAGDIIIERSDFLPDHEDTPASTRLIEGSVANVVVRDTTLPSLEIPYDGAPSGYTALAGQSLTLETVAVPAIPDNVPDFAPPTLAFTSTAGTASISGPVQLAIELENCSATLDNAVINGLTMDPSLGLAMTDSTAWNGVVSARGGAVTVDGGMLIDSGLNLLDVDATIENLLVVGGETALYTERSTIDIKRSTFSEVNRANSSPSNGGVLIAHDSDLRVESCLFDGGAAATSWDYPFNTPSAIIGTSGTTNAAIVNSSMVDCWGASGGLLSSRDSSTIVLANATIRACGSLNGPLLTNARPGTSVRFEQVLISGNDATDTRVNPKSVARASPNASVQFLSCTLWHNNVVGNPFEGDVTFINSLVEGVDPIAPGFVSIPDDGGDGFYNSRSNTPGIDESLNNDYGDLRLRPDSPAIDAGDSTALPTDLFDLDGDTDTSEAIPFDLGGSPRTIDDPATPDSGPVTPAVDLGAYEFTPPPCPADLNGDGALNFDDIDAFVVAFLAGDGLADLDGNGVINFDDIDLFVNTWLSGCP